MDPAALVERALGGTGLNLAGSCSIEAYDARAPPGHRAADLMPRARGVVVVGSAGRELWSQFRAATAADGAILRRPQPLDSYVASLLDRADSALAEGRVGSRRFEPRLDARIPLDFRALGELVGLGSMGPFGLLIHAIHGPWWALRAAWLVDAPVAEARSHAAPCPGCHAPCLGSSRGSEGILLATASVRGRCVVGQGSRYSDEQVSYHYDREATLERMRGGG